MKSSCRWVVDHWEVLFRPAMEVRRNVFGAEMSIQEEVDFNGTDGDCVHIVAFRDGQAVATGRLCPSEARIGRMAVLAAHRSQGLGSEMLDRLLREAVRVGLPTVSLHAQEQAIGFYRKHGFSHEGPRFSEAGIQHQRMHRGLAWRDAVAGALVRDGRILLGLRAPDCTKAGHWDLFGGKVEPGEDDVAALRREILEELALQVEPDRLLDVIIYDDCGDEQIWRCPVYRVSLWKGTVTLNEEHLDAGWFTAEELGELRLAHPRLQRLAKSACALGE